MSLNIHIVGGTGQLGLAMVKGLVNQADGDYTISISGPDKGKLNEIAKQYKVNTSRNNLKYLKLTDIFIVAVKPNKVLEVLRQLGQAASEPLNKKLVMCTAAAIPLADMQKQAGAGLVVVRIMPNLSAAVQKSLTAWYATDINSDQESQVEKLLKLLGKSLKVQDDSQIDCFTIHSATGLAIHANFLKAMIDSGVYIGLRRDYALLSSIQTMAGLLELMKENIYADLDAVVTSVETPNGTTVEATLVLKENGFSAIVIKSIKSGMEKIKIISQKLTFLRQIPTNGESLETVEQKIK